VPIFQVEEYFGYRIHRISPETAINHPSFTFTRSISPVKRYR
jgi:hypothetical protein